MVDDAVFGGQVEVGEHAGIDRAFKVDHAGHLDIAAIGAEGVPNGRAVVGRDVADNQIAGSVNICVARLFDIHEAGKGVVRIGQICRGRGGIQHRRPGVDRLRRCLIDCAARAHDQRAGRVDLTKRDGAGGYKLHRAAVRADRLTETVASRVELNPRTRRGCQIRHASDGDRLRRRVRNPAALRNDGQRTGRGDGAQNHVIRLGDRNVRARGVDGR